MLPAARFMGDPCTKAIPSYQSCEMSDRSDDVQIASIELSLPGSNQRGRAFFDADFHGSIPRKELQAQFERTFIDDDDKPRLERLREVLKRPSVVVELYPGDGSPVEFHAYVRPVGETGHIFACVLGPTAFVRMMLAASPHVALETSTFQAIADDPTPIALLAGVQAWITRLWPGMPLPHIELNEWPDVEGSVLRQVSSVLLELSKAKMVDAPEELKVEPHRLPRSA
jgi:hypothetical protein